MSSPLDDMDLPFTAIQMITVNEDGTATSAAWSFNEEGIRVIKEMLGPPQMEAMIDAEHLNSVWSAGLGGTSFYYPDAGIP